MPSPNNHRIDVREIPAERLEWKIQWLVDAISAEDPLSCAAALVATSDIRPEEALGLSWGDVDLPSMTANVRRACTRDGLKPAKQARAVKLSQRSAWALECLLASRAKSKRGRRNPTPSADEPVFRDVNGKRASRELFSDWWRRRRHEFGMYKWTLLDLRKAGMSYAASKSEAGC